MGDQLLLDVERGMQAVRDRSRRNIDESDSAGMAEVNSGIEAINSVTSAVMSGFVQIVSLRGSAASKVGELGTVG